LEKALIISTGTSQLIYQLSALTTIHNKNYKLSVVYLGVNRKSIDEFYKETSKKIGFKYLGQFNFNKPISKVNSVTRLLYYIRFRRSYLKTKLSSLPDNLITYVGCSNIIIPVRVKVHSDILLLSLLKPKNLILVADGVVDKFEERDYSGYAYNYLDSTLKALPIKNKPIYTPLHLINDIKKIGMPKQIKIESTLSKIYQLNLVKNFKKQYLTNQITHVILSQHYHLHENISFDDDMDYFKGMIDLILNNDDKSLILFKAHPRDLTKKIKEIEMLNLKRIIVVDDQYKSVPIEVCYKEFIKMKTTFFTGNSSAPLYFKNTNPIYCITSEVLLPETLNNSIKDFAKRFNLRQLELNK